MKNKKICLNSVVLMVIVLGLPMHKLQCAHLYDDVKIAKCCPEGSELTVNVEEGIKTSYVCNITTGFSETNQTLFGYNFDISDDIRIPTCDDIEMFDFEVDGGLISSDGCIDIYKGILHGLRCSDKLRVEVHKLYKCCAEGRTKKKFFLQ